MDIKKYIFPPVVFILFVSFFSTYVSAEETVPDVTVAFDNGTYSAGRFAAEAAITFNKPELYNDSVKFSYHIYGPSGELLRWEGIRTPFSTDGREGKVVLEIDRTVLDLPENTSEFIIRPDLIDEKNLFWFDGNPEITSSFPSLRIRLEPADAPASVPGAKGLLKDGVENSFGDSTPGAADKAASSASYVVGNQKIQLLLNLLAALLLIAAFFLYRRKEKVSESPRAENYVVSKKASEPLDVSDGDVKKLIPREKTLFERLAGFFYGPLYERLDVLERQARLGKKNLDELRSKAEENELARVSKLDNIMGKLEALEYVSLRNFEYIKTKIEALDHTIIVNFDMVKNTQELFGKVYGARADDTLHTIKAMDHTIIVNFDRVLNALSALTSYGMNAERSLQGLEYITVNNFDQVKHLCSSASGEVARLKKEIGLEALRTAETVFTDCLGLRPWNEKKYPTARRRIYESFLKSLDCEGEFRYFEHVPFEFLKKACGEKVPRAVYGAWAREAAEVIGARTALKPFWGQEFQKSPEGGLCPVPLLPDFMGENASLVVTSSRITEVLCASDGILEAVRDKLTESLVLCASFGVERFESQWVNFGAREGEKGAWKKWAVNFKEDSYLIIYNNSGSLVRATLSFTLLSVQKKASVCVDTAAGSEIFGDCAHAAEAVVSCELKPGRNEIRFRFDGDNDTVAGDWRELKFSITEPILKIEDHEKTAAVHLLDREETNAAYLDDFMRQRLHTAGFYTIEAKICSKGGLYERDLPSSSFAFLNAYDIGKPTHEIIYKAASELYAKEIPVVYVAYRKDLPRR